MESPKDLAARLQEVILDGKWVAFTNVKEQIEDISWEEATTKIEPLNTIAALTFHLNYYIAGVLEFFKNGKLTISDKYSWDMHPIDDAESWKTLRAALFQNTTELIAEIEKLPNEKLSEAFVKKEYGTYTRNIAGMIEHCYYHFGQIVIIKKMVLLQSAL